MRIVTVRRISQAFFALLFLWLCVVSSVGRNFWQLRGWPVNWFLQLDPLVAVGTALATGVLFAGLLWALATVVGTIIFGRFFCGWVCPFGAMHQLVGYLGWRRRAVAAKVQANKYRRAQAIKYYVLAFLLAAAAGNWVTNLIRASAGREILLAVVVGAGLLAVAAAALMKVMSSPAKAVAAVLILAAVWVGLALVLSDDTRAVVSNQIGLLDPIALAHRSVNLVLLPIVDSGAERLWPAHRLYEGAWLIGGIFLAAVGANLLIPRFYCRFICPLGALLALLGRFAIWRIGKRQSSCSMCRLCDADCQGACEPSEEIRISECLLCMNCLDGCPDGLMRYGTSASASGEITAPDVSRRGLLLSIVSGMAAVPVLRLAGRVGPNWQSGLIRPPGALPEEDFLARCIKCGQCMRICPTNVIQPAGLAGGLECLWTPALNNRIGTSGCQLNCVACGNVCPTGAIRAITLDERLGRGKYADAGPIRLGTAFVDRGRCLPWAMDKPCIVCQENCPVSPKAIFIREDFSMVRGGLVVKQSDGRIVVIGGGLLDEDRFATGDYYCRLTGQADRRRRRIASNTADTITIAPARPWTPPPPPGSKIEIQIRLQRPYVDPARCIGCGVCEHECPVSGRRAIRVTAENESRSPGRSLLL